MGVNEGNGSAAAVAIGVYVFVGLSEKVKVDVGCEVREGETVLLICPGWVAHADKGNPRKP